MTSIAEQMSHLERALDLGEGRFDPVAIESGREVLANAAGRASRSAETTVAALFGATGSGKSSLTNELAGGTYAAVAHRRPTTTTPLALTRDLPPKVSDLLDWLEIPTRQTVPALPANLVLVDMPDVDSVVAEHRQVSEKMAKVVDVLVWVLDPQKYADAVLHDEFLAPLSHQAEVTIVVLNQIDTVDPGDLARIISDARRLLAADGIADAHILPVSARTGAGVADLAARLAQVARTNESARAKARAEIRHAAARLLDGQEATGRGFDLAVADSAPVVEAAAQAAGMAALSSAVDRSYRRRASGKAGWPFVRWVRRFRPDPLARLHIATGSERSIERAELSAVTSLPEPTPVQSARLRASAQQFVLDSTTTMPDRWRGEIVADAEARIPALTDSLDETLGGLKLPLRAPAWWTVAAALQVIGAIALIGGLAWLAVLAVAGYLQFDLPVPTWRRLPVPTLIAAAGLIIGLVTAVVARWAAAVGGRRRAALTKRRVREAVASKVERQLIDPVGQQLADYGLFIDSARRAAA